MFPSQQHYSGPEKATILKKLKDGRALSRNKRVSHDHRRPKSASENKNSTKSTTNWLNVWNHWANLDVDTTSG